MREVYCFAGGETNKKYTPNRVIQKYALFSGNIAVMRSVYLLSAPPYGGRFIHLTDMAVGINPDFKSLGVYMLQVPANRIGYTVLSLAQLKILQEVITLAVFVPFVVYYMKQPLKLDYLYAGFCLVGAVYFIFRS